MYIFLLTEFSTNIVMQKYYVDKKKTLKINYLCKAYASKVKTVQDSDFRPGSYFQKFTSENWGFIHIIAFNENPLGY